MRIPGSLLGTPALLVLLLVAHFGFRDPVERLRLGILRALVTPHSWVGRNGARTLPSASPASIDGGGRPRTGFLGHGPGFTVLDLDPGRRRMLLVGGESSGIRVGSLVTAGGGAVGVVDAVTENLARVRLLDAKGLTVPVAVQCEGRRLPGDLEVFAATLEGSGSFAFLKGAFLPESIREGDRIVTVPREGVASCPVGVVVEIGLEPRVRLTTPVSGIARCEVPPATAPEGRPLFEDVALVTLTPRAGFDALAIAVGQGIQAVEAGSAVHAEGWYFGRVLGTGSGCVSIERWDRRGSRMRVRILVPGRADVVTSLEGDGEEAATIVEEGSGSSGEADVATVVTESGSELVPSGLLVGLGRLSAGRVHWILRAPFPQRILVAGFRHASERRQLSQGRP